MLTPNKGENIIHRLESQRKTGASDAFSAIKHPMPVMKKVEPKPKPTINEKDIFKGKPWGFKYDLEKEVGKELKEKLKLTGPKADEKAKELTGRIIPKNIGSTIYRSTAQGALENEKWDAKHAAEKDSHNYKAQADRRKEDEALKDILKNK